MSRESVAASWSMVCGASVSGNRADAVVTGRGPYVVLVCSRSVSW